jgi:arylsulfatase
MHVPAWESLPDSTKRYYAALMEVYAAMMDNLDQNIGRLISKLEATGDIDHTLILFLSDNGGCHEAPHRGRPDAAPGSPDSFDGYEYAWANVSNTPFKWFKHWVHEGGISTPLIAWYPSMIEGGRRSPVVGHIMDIMPTLVEFTHAAYPQTYKGHEILPPEGRSLMPVFAGHDSIGHEFLYWEHEGNRAMRQGDWKIVSRFNYKANEPYPWELYNLSEDRTESNDLAAQHPERVEEMIPLYDFWAERCHVVPFENIRRKRHPDRY